MQKTIEIKCKGEFFADIDHLVPFQGNLKELSRENYEKLKKKILELGFCEPVTVWKTKGKLYLANGHQRVRTLKKMRSEGYEVPEIPCNSVECKSKSQAKRLVLSLTSQYGQITEEGLYEFMAEADIPIAEVEESFAFAEVDMEHFKAGYFEEVEPEEEEQCPTCNQRVKS